MLSRRIVLLLIPVLALVLYGLNMARFAGAYVSYEQTDLAACDDVYVLPGAEDFVSIQDRGILVSAVDRKNHDPDFIDGIYWLADGGEPVLVSIDAPSTFHPHGLSLYTDDNLTLLYAVSHDGDLYGEDEGHSVEVFEFTEEDKLKHLRSIRHEAIRSPNDLAVVGLDQFYISNDWYFLKGFMRLVEQYFLLPITNVIYYDNGTATEAASSLKYANGVTAAKGLDGRWSKLYVSEVMGRRVKEFDINSDNAKLQHSRTFSVGGSPDNISVAPNGDLIIAVIHDGFGFNAFSSGKATTAPALIRRFNPVTSEISNAFYTENGLISGATSGLIHNNKLFIGTAYDNKLLACGL